MNILHVQKSIRKIRNGKKNLRNEYRKRGQSISSDDLTAKTEAHLCSDHPQAILEITKMFPSDLEAHHIPLITVTCSFENLVKDEFITFYLNNTNCRVWRTLLEHFYERCRFF